MRIAFVLTQFPVLSQTFVLDQITGLIDRGHDVEIFAGRPRARDEKTHPDIKRYGLLDRTHYWPQNKRAGVVALRRAIAAGWQSHRLGAFAKTVARLLAVFINPHSQSSAAVLTKRAFVAYRGSPYDAIVCHFGPAGLEAQMLRDVGALQGKLITIFHAYDLTTYVSAHGEEVYQRLFKAGELFLPISKHGQERLEGLGCPSERIEVHHMGIDCERFVMRERHAEDVVRIVSVARFVEKKGLPVALRAVAQIADSHPGLEYHIVGDGPMSDEMETLIEELNLHDRVRLHGWKTRDELVDLLGRMHLLVAPSVTAANGDKEGIPVALMEAMARGLPVISTYHSGIPELVVDGESGLLVAERDVEALALKLDWLLNHPEEWPRMGRRGRKQVLESFNAQQLNSQFELLLAELVQSA